MFKLQGKVIDKYNTFIITLHAEKCMLEYKQWRQQYNKIIRPKCLQSNYHCFASGHKTSQ